MAAQVGEADGEQNAHPIVQQTEGTVETFIDAAEHFEDELSSVPTALVDLHQLLYSVEHSNDEHVPLDDYEHVRRCGVACGLNRFIMLLD
jgi:hypothetical protein